jgi:hypothetical protein
MVAAASITVSASVIYLLTHENKERTVADQKSSKS